MAGPPLSIDDPGILEPGSWELIVSFSTEDRNSVDMSQAPLMDISLGVTPNSQLSLSLPRLIVSPQGDAEKSGLGFVTLGYKWRLFASPDWEMAIASNYSLPVSYDVIRRHGPEDIRVLGLPLLVSRTIGKWNWLGQIGWNAGSDGVRFWDYGLALSHPAGKSTVLMLELHGNATSEFKESTVNYRLGLDYAISPRLHVLAAYGSGIKSLPEPDFRLRHTMYFGIQWYY
jgi:hypothetical protein